MFESRWREKPSAEAAKSAARAKRPAPKPVIKGSRIMDTKTKRKVRGSRSMLRTQIVVGLFLAILLGLILTGIYYGTRVASLQLTNVTVTGGFTISHTEIQQDVSQLLQGTYFRLIPRRFVWLYPKHAIEAKLSTIPRLQQVTLTPAGHNTLNVAFTEYQPFALWCAQATSSTCWFLDQNGFAFASAPDLSGDAFVRYTTTATTTNAAWQAIDPNLMHMTTAFSTLLQTELGLYVTRVAVLDGGDIDYVVSGGGVIKTTSSMPILDTYNNLKTILSNGSFSTLTDGKFQYIDLRFGNKVYVNDSSATTSSSTATTSAPAS